MPPKVKIQSDNERFCPSQTETISNDQLIRYQELCLFQHRLVSTAMPSGWGSMMFSLSTEPPFDGVLSVSEMFGALDPGWQVMLHRQADRWLGMPCGPADVGVPCWVKATVVQLRPDLDAQPSPSSNSFPSRNLPETLKFSRESVHFRRAKGLEGGRDQHRYYLTVSHHSQPALQS